MSMRELVLTEFGKDFGPYRRTIVEVGKQYPNVVVLGADLGNSTEIDLFQQTFPERFFNMGAAEQNEIDVAVGLSFEGEIPFVHSFSVFVARRPYEQVCVQVAMHNANVKLIGFIPGLTSRLGPTHQAIDDLSLMRTLPNMTVIDPADATEIEQLVWALAEHDGPVYTRMMRREMPVIFDPGRYKFQIGRAVPVRDGGDIAIFSTGLILKEVIPAAGALAKQGIEATVIHVPTLKPLDRETILTAAEKCGAVLTVENHLISGGLGSAVAELLGEELPTPMHRVGVRDQFAEPGTPDYLFDKYGLSAKHIVASAKALLERVR